MKGILKCILILLLFLGGQSLIAQVDEHNHEADHHEHHRNEIGVANSPVYFVNEKEFSYAFHIHYIRNIEDSKFGYGVGYERIFDDHEHSTYGIVGMYRPFDKFGVALSPGVTIENDDWSEVHFAVHVETSYEFEIKDIHIGPVLEFAYDPEDYHISLGLHVGFGF